MTTNALISNYVTYFDKGNQIDMATYPSKEDWLNRVTPALQLLESKGLAVLTLGEYNFLPLSATLTKAGRERRNKELNVNL